MTFPSEFWFSSLICFQHLNTKPVDYDQAFISQNKYPRHSYSRTQTKLHIPFVTLARLYFFIFQIMTTLSHSHQTLRKSVHSKTKVPDVLSSLSSKTSPLSSSWVWSGAQVMLKSLKNGGVVDWCFLLFSAGTSMEITIMKTRSKRIISDTQRHLPMAFFDHFFGVDCMASTNSSVIFPDFLHQLGEFRAKSLQKIGILMMHLKSLEDWRLGTSKKSWKELELDLRSRP